MISVISLVSCSSTKPVFDFDDAVRIKEPFWDSVKYEPNTNLKRNPAALRGQAVKIITEYNLDSCHTDNPIPIKRDYLLFVDSVAKRNEQVRFEKIPLEYIDFIGTRSDLSLGINWFENYNDPLNPKSIREIPFDTVSFDCGTCNCNPLSLNMALNMGFDFNFNLRCPTRNLKSYFVEIKGGYLAYTDFEAMRTGKIGKDVYAGEVTLGRRFGSASQYALGLMYSTGPKLQNSLMPLGIETYRPLAMFYGKWSFLESARHLQVIKEGAEIEEIDIYKPSCVRPFVYGLLGMSVDRLTVDLFKTWSCSDCNSQINSPNLDVRIPLSYGLGVGVDITVAGPVDLSFDLGYRNVSFGESMFLFGFSNAPSRRRVDMLSLRMGLVLDILGDRK